MSKKEKKQLFEALFQKHNWVNPPNRTAPTSNWPTESLLLAEALKHRRRKGRKVIIVKKLKI